MIQKVKRDPAFEKCDSPDGFEALDIRLAAALKGALPHPLRYCDSEGESPRADHWTSPAWRTNPMCHNRMVSR